MEWGSIAVDQMERAVEMAEALIGGAYWEACDAAKCAIDPARLTAVTWVREYLADHHRIALEIEADAEPWEIARKVVVASPA